MRYQRENSEIILTWLKNLSVKQADVRFFDAIILNTSRDRLIHSRYLSYEKENYEANDELGFVSIRIAGPNETIT
jgi:hypothetical protein